MDLYPPSPLQLPTPLQLGILRQTYLLTRAAWYNSDGLNCVDIDYYHDNDVCLDLIERVSGPAVSSLPLAAPSPSIRILQQKHLLTRAA